ncbi:MAG TPA: TlpA disulfide reductase family protein [Gammaproteobacteria bacterium]|nr:TlpA disulfide reductase family protein [Gammaproteobacteria bacterium]
MTRRELLLLALIAVLAAAAGASAYLWLAPPPARDTAEGTPPVVPRPTRLTDFELKDLTGTSRSSREWAGKALLINFWATWCPPCRKEIPLLVEAQRKYEAAGLQVVGIAVDNIEAVRGFADEMGVNYPMLVGEQEALDVAASLGAELYGLPVSVLVDRQGNILAVRMGEIRPEEIEGLVQTLLASDATARPLGGGS